MIQAYQGHFKEDGLFIADNMIVKIPTNRRVIINVLDETVDTEIMQNEEEDIAKRLAIVESLKGIIPSDVDLEAMRAERIAKRGLLE